MKHPVHVDKVTGSFQELAHASDVEFGQLSILTVKPGQTRGGHYHTRKTEWFCCLHGRCDLKMLSTKGHYFTVRTLDGRRKEFVEVPCPYSHSVTNPGTRTCELLVISSEVYDPNDADTYEGVYDALLEKGTQ